MTSSEWVKGFTIIFVIEETKAEMSTKTDQLLIVLSILEGKLHKQSNYNHLHH